MRYRGPLLYLSFFIISFFFFSTYHHSLRSEFFLVFHPSYFLSILLSSLLFFHLPSFTRYRHFISPIPSSFGYSLVCLCRSWKRNVIHTNTRDVLRHHHTEISNMHQRWWFSSCFSSLRVVRSILKRRLFFYAVVCWQVTSSQREKEKDNRGKIIIIRRRKRRRNKTQKQNEAKWKVTKKRRRWRWRRKKEKKENRNKRVRCIHKAKINRKTGKNKWKN